MGVLEEVIEHCLGEEAGGYTPSDFPEVQLTVDEVDGIENNQAGIEDEKAADGGRSTGFRAMQQGLLFHSLYEAGAGTYYEQMSCRIQGPLDAGAFERAWQAVVERHAVLRTSFEWEGVTHPVQVVHRRARLVFGQEDWRGASRAEQTDRLKELLRRERQEGFDLRKAPLMRAGLVRVEDEAYYFVWGNHHILFDGWCRQLIIGEVFKLYEGYRLGVEAGLGRVRAYRDYIGWLGEQDLKSGRGVLGRGAERCTGAY